MVPPAGAAAPSAGRRRAPHLLAAAFITSGVVHLVRPRLFTPIVPRILPRPRELVYASGVAELVCGAGLLRRADWAPTASTALLVAVWPANVQMALDARSSPKRLWRLAMWVRVALQLPMIWAARQQ